MSRLTGGIFISHFAVAAERSMALLASLLPFAALMSPSLRPGTGPPSRPVIDQRCASPQCSGRTELDVVVKRGAEGGLGVLVDQDNTVVTVTAQPSLQVGDVIVGVDGEQLRGKPVGQALTPGNAEYTFSIVRPSSAEAAQSLERVLVEIVRKSQDDRPGAPPKLVCLANDEEQSERAGVLIKQMEEVGMPSENELAFALKSGFWRLVLCSEMETAAGGLTGYGLAPYCSVLASFQAFIDLKEEQTAQVVEVVANSNLGMSNVAALKGTWAKGGEGDSSTDETYDRKEYGGSPELDAEAVGSKSVCTYLSDRMRIVREGGTNKEGAWKVYVKMSANDAQMEISRLMSLPVQRDIRDARDWPDDRLGGGWGRGGIGGGGYSPEPTPDALR